MRTVTVILAALLAVSTFAQQGGGRGSMGRMADPQARLDMLVERLDLSVEQADAIAPILAELGDKRRTMMRAARSQGPEGFQGMRTQMMEIQAETESRLAEFLTVEQMDMMRAMRDEERARRRERMEERMEERAGRMGAGMSGRPSFSRIDAPFPKTGERIPDLVLVDDQGQPAKLRALAQGHYTVMTLGCLT